MHPNPIFRAEPRERDVAFARERGFGTLCVGADPAPLLAHIPFALNEGGTMAQLHLVRSNPIARLPDGPAVIAVTGPDGYVSPDWYAVPDQVPTWNYVAVHLRGRLEARPAEEMHAMLDAQSAHFEAMLEPKPRWTTAKMTPDVLNRMMRQILPFHFHVEDIQGTWKLGQNKPDAVRAHAAAAMSAYGIGLEPALLSALMRGVPAKEST
ncbi:MAG: FMN-binding negative transcriptional regulator [Pseudomonadota bacterium]